MSTKCYHLRKTTYAAAELSYHPLSSFLFPPNLPFTNNNLPLLLLLLLQDPPRCDNLSYLEHVQVKVNLTAYKRGDIEIRLTSPAGTTSTLLAVRPMDNSRMGFANWPFMTVHCWGERPTGHWKLTVINHGRNSEAFSPSF